MRGSATDKRRSASDEEGRDAAYEGLPKAARAALHERFALWLEEHAMDLPELDEIVGWHLEHARRYRLELGEPADPALSRQAASRLHAAGRRAADRNDAAAAQRLLERALALIPSDLAARTEIALDLAQTLVDQGDHAAVEALLAELDEHAHADAAITLIRLQWLIRVRPNEAIPEIESSLPRVIAEFERTGDERGLARAHITAFWTHWLASQATLAAADLRLAAEYAQKAGAAGMRVQALGWYVAALIYGGQPVAEMKRELEWIAAQHPGPYLAAWMVLGHAEVAEFEGRFDEARDGVRSALGQFDALGLRILSGGVGQVLGRIELSAGDPAAARRNLLETDALLAEVGDRSFRSTTQALLAQANERLGDHKAARAAIELSESLGAAERWARTGVEQALRTDFPIIQGDAKLELARVLAAAGEREEAANEARGALALFEAKQHQPHAAVARSLLEWLEAGALKPKPRTDAGRS